MGKKVLTGKQLQRLKAYNKNKRLCVVQLYNTLIIYNYNKI